MRAQLLTFGEDVESRNLHINRPAEVLRNQQQERTELAALRAENKELRAAMAARTPISATRSDPNFGPRMHRPLDRTERQALAEGAAEQLLSDLQQELQMLKQEKEELQHQLQHEQIPIGQMGLPQSSTHPRSEVFRRLLNHTEPLTSIMQGYHAHGALTLLTGNLPIIRKKRVPESRPIRRIVGTRGF